MMIKPKKIIKVFNKIKHIRYVIFWSNFQLQGHVFYFCKFCSLVTSDAITENRSELNSELIMDEPWLSSAFPKLGKFCETWMTKNLMKIQVTLIIHCKIGCSLWLKIMFFEVSRVVKFLYYICLIDEQCTSVMTKCKQFYESWYYRQLST